MTSNDQINLGFLNKLHKNCRIFEFLRKNHSPILDNVIFHNVSNKKINHTPKPITVLQIIQTIILKINPEFEFQARPISFFLIIQKSEKNRTKNSLKKLTFTTLRPTHFEIFFRKFEVIAFLFTKLYTDSEKIVHFWRNGCRLLTCLPHTVKASHCPFYC